MPDVIASTYELIGEIGEGGGGTVYLARHLRLDKKVILKADKRKVTTRPELLRREVDVLKDLSHSYIPQVYDYFMENETVYTAMDYIEGESLDKPLKRGEIFQQPQVLRWVMQLLEALAYLHSPVHGNPPRGYVHSDIKPANLMRTRSDDICLIDFNIALALGEENVIGCSAGYASPEHYGLDFSSNEDTATLRSRFGGKRVSPRKRKAPSDTTLPLENSSETGGMSNPSRGSHSGSSIRVIVPDVRSDIYSVGATLYHLLCGRRPARDATEVEPLSTEAFSPQVVAILSKAMNPNPDLRYQTAEEMLDALRRLHENDPRMRRWKKSRNIAASFLGMLFIAGTVSAFVGLKRMQAAEKSLKLAEYSQNAFAEGDGRAAIQYALQALPLEKGIFVPEFPAQAQKALANALGVYGLADNFKVHRTVELPSAPFWLELSPDGRYGCCIYAYSLAVFDTETAETVCTLPAVESALSEVRFLDSHTVLYAGRDGLQAYDIEAGKVVWAGLPATAVSLSGDGKRAAAVYRDEDFATVYDTAQGEILCKVSFDGRRQKVMANDVGANPRDNLLSLNGDGTLLGVSFEDGSLQVYDVDGLGGGAALLEDGSGYSHFEGGFCGQYFAFSASAKDGSVLGILDAGSWEQLWGFQADYKYGVQADESGIYVLADNILVRVDPVTGEQEPFVDTAETLYDFARGGGHTLAVSENQFMVFGKGVQLTSVFGKEPGSGLVRISGETALMASGDSPSVRIAKYENHPEAELFSYDPSYRHEEARVSADGESVMLFSHEGFRIYDVGGGLAAEVDIPNQGQVYDQQYIREEGASRLEVKYNDGKVLAYDAGSGALLSEEPGPAPDGSLDETFYVGNLRIEAPLHGTPAAYDAETGKRIAKLDQDAYLTYAVQAGSYVVAQFVTVDGYYYGQLLNERCEVLAELPYLSDVIGETLIFDYPTGNMRRSRIYNIGELLSIAQQILRDEEERT